MQGYNGGASLAVREDLKEYLKGLAEDDDSQFTMLYIVFSFSMLLGSLFETEYKHIVESGSSVVLDVILTNHYLGEDSELDEAKIKNLIEGKIFDSNPLDVDFQAFKMTSFCPPKSKDGDHTDDCNADVSKDISFMTNAKQCKRGNPGYRCQMCSNEDCPSHGDPRNQ